MKPGDFDNNIRAVMAEKRSWFEGVEPPVNEDAVIKVEAKLGCALPSQFKHFAVTFGGGYFGGVNISTLDEESEWYVLARPIIKINDKRMLIVSDDETGGYYGFLRSEDSFGSRIIYKNYNDGNYREEVASSFFNFIDKFAINM